MTTITLQLEDEKAQLLRDKAELYGLDLEQFLTASIAELANQSEEDFERAATE
ncbi:MAG: hypothetical protein HN904_26935, partial [Victivallales bacterium]|nr:hypothetical protein [Victivallales bacterium]